MKQAGNELFETENIWKILWKIAPPVMLAQLIQSLYNIVDSYFVGRYSGSGLTALSVIFPIQLVIVALAVGTGVGVNILIARQLAEQKYEDANSVAGVGEVLALLTWAVFSVASVFLLPLYIHVSAQSQQVVADAQTYGFIVCIGSLGIFMESIWTKVHQASGNMKLPMAAQIAGAVTNIVLDPLLIFGVGFFPALGIAGAAIATVAGQFVAAILTGIAAFRRPPRPADCLRHAKKIYRLACPSIFMQLLVTLYIVVLNIILAGFSDSAVTVLGLYYKVQTFFFIPLLGFQTCIIPVLSYTFARGSYDRCKSIFKDAVLVALAFMLLGVFCFECLPGQMISLFSRDEQVLSIGIPAFRIIGASFLPAVPALITPIFFQAIGATLPSVLLSLTRQLFCLIPIFWFFSKIGLAYTWLAFPIAETVTMGVGLILYARQSRRWSRAASSTVMPT